MTKQLYHTRDYPAHIGAFSQAFPQAHLVPCGYNGKEKAAGPGWGKPADHVAMRRHAWRRP